MKYLIFQNNELILTLANERKALAYEVIENTVVKKVANSHAEQNIKLNDAGEIVEKHSEAELLMLEIEKKSAEYTVAVQTHLDNTAKQKRYDNIISACTYAATAVDSKFKKEGTAYLLWRNAIWGFMDIEFIKIQNGERAMPATADDLIAELPKIADFFAEQGLTW